MDQKGNTPTIALLYKNNTKNYIKNLNSNPKF